MSKLENYTDQFLSEMRQQTDPLADQAVEAINFAENKTYFKKLFGTLVRNDYIIPPEFPIEVREYLEKTRHVPACADAKRMARGAQFFGKHAPSLMALLGMLSLPYCYAAAHGARVLCFSERLHTEPGKRLAETGQYIFDVTANNAFSAKGKAISSTQKVRLIHAVVRYHIRKSNRWDDEVWGKPINQEDMAGTNLAIAWIAIRGLRKMGVQVTYKEATDYLHLWNVAGCIMGLDERLLPDTGKEAFLLDKMISTRQFESSEAGKALTASLLKYTVRQAGGPAAKLAPAYMRFLLGDEIADLLGISKSKISSQLTINGIRTFNRLRNMGGYTENNYYQAYSHLRAQYV
jgi:hypothetical protein